MKVGALGHWGQLGIVIVSLVCALATLAACDTFRERTTRIVTATSTPLPTGVSGAAAHHFQRGDELFDNGDIPGAIDEYSRALELKPDFAEAYNNRGYAEWKWNENEAALADFSKAIELRPDYGNAFTNRAFVYFDLNDFEHCITDATRAIELDPNNISALTIRGDAEQRLGRWGAAFEDFLEVNRVRQAQQGQ